MAMPNVVGDKADAAHQQLTDLGLTITYKFDKLDDPNIEGATSEITIQHADIEGDDDWYVTAQTPAPGSAILDGGTATLKVDALVRVIGDKPIVAVAHHDGWKDQGGVIWWLDLAGNRIADPDNMNAGGVAAQDKKPVEPSGGLLKLKYRPPGEVLID